jgi:hypothetical protein
MDELPEHLGTVFSFRAAREAGVPERAIYRMRDEGIIESISRGLYQKITSEPSDLDMLEIATKMPIATLCLGAALARHDLSDLIPSYADLAIPRGRRPPVVTIPVSWHQFAVGTFHLGRELIPVGDGKSIGIYSPMRCLIDVFRMRDREGSEVAYEALRRWLRRRGSAPGQLMEMAKSFPRARPALGHALDVLL